MNALAAEDLWHPLGPHRRPSLRVGVAQAAARGRLGLGAVPPTAPRQRLGGPTGAVFGP